MRDFNHTVSILVKSYLNGDLIHSSCRACAVGNIIRGNGVQLIVDKQNSDTFWLRYIKHAVRREDCVGYYDEEIAEQQIECTGYTPGQLSLIEKTFEAAPYGLSDDERMFRGLMAVVDCLADIHGIDLTAKEQAKLLFVKA